MTCELDSDDALVGSVAGCLHLCVDFPVAACWCVKQLCQPVEMSPYGARCVKSRCWVSEGSSSAATHFDAWLGSDLAPISFSLLMANYLEIL